MKCESCNMIYRGFRLWDVGRQGSCVLYSVADRGSQGRSRLIKRFKRRCLGIIYFSCCTRYFLWKILSMITLICSFRSRKVGFTENLPVEWNNAALAETVTVNGLAALMYGLPKIELIDNVIAILHG